MARIKTRTATDGTPRYTAEVRLKGYPAQTATFKRKTDATKWIQNTESAIREGRHVALGIDGLIGNGVDKAKIKQIKATYTPMIEELVKDCDKQKNWIRGDITYEYDDLINGRSKLRDLVIRALFIVDSIIADAGF